MPGDRDIRLTIDPIGRFGLSIDLINNVPSLLVVVELGTWRSEIHE
jgi:hypothetical protein